MRLIASKKDDNSSKVEEKEESYRATDSVLDDLLTMVDGEMDNSALIKSQKNVHREVESIKTEVRGHLGEEKAESCRQVFVGSSNFASGCCSSSLRPVCLSIRPSHIYYPFSFF